MMTFSCSAGSIAGGFYPGRPRRLTSMLLALLLIALAAPGSMAWSANDTPKKEQLPGVTIESARERALRLKVDRFVTSVVAQPFNAPLNRWNDPVCPLVAGLPKAFGEFILQRISKAARDAHAPLAGSVCHPNLYVVATDDPDRLLKMWWRRDVQMYDTRYVGMERVKDFVNSTEPIRVWYNTTLGCGIKSRMRRPPTIFINNFALPGVFAPPGCDPTHGVDSHLSYGTSRSSISTAIVVVDGRRMKGITMRQMADYIALVGLADVRLDSDSLPVPSILGLFGRASPPQALTPWDRALLYSLYNTDQMSKLQMQEVEIAMTRRLASLD